jgi:hypothetical protein
MYNSGHYERSNRPYAIQTALALKWLKKVKCLPIMNKVNRFFLFCSGVNLSMIKKSPTENNKYVGIGATVLFTGLFAAIAAAYAFFVISDNIFFAATIGPLWGLMIFNLDRLIVSSMKKTGSLKTDLLAISPRLILAIFISLVIAKPLELKIFEKEIDDELIQISNNSIKQQAAKIDSTYTRKRNEYKAQIQSLKSELKEKEQFRNEIVQIAQQEADGTGGSKLRNLGPIYQLKKRDADNIRSEYQQIKLQYTNLIDAQQKIIYDLSKEKQLQIASIHKPTADGIAARMVALERLATKNSVIATTQLFIVLLFMLIETTPISLKIMLNKGPYEKITKSFEKKLQNRYKSVYQ